MQLIGMLDSPFVRRVAITMQFLGVEYEHWPLSIFKTYDKFRTVNPLVKVPTLVFDDGEMLVDSSLIIEYVESLAGRSLMPAGMDANRRALQQIGVDMMINPDGSPNTAHTKNPVPVIFATNADGQFEMRDGILADLAPTLLRIIGMEQPELMTGSSLLNYQ